MDGALHGASEYFSYIKVRSYAEFSSSFDKKLLEFGFLYEAINSSAMDTEFIVGCLPGEIQRLPDEVEQRAAKWSARQIFAMNEVVLQ